MSKKKRLFASVTIGLNHGWIHIDMFSLSLSLPWYIPSEYNLLPHWPLALQVLLPVEQNWHKVKKKKRKEKKK